ncbi:30S ribosomal protein S16 [Nakamurella lactea]|uniref:30S ribosomal protein S16 n=1 Tax=Nakamurella lactea TaxID=459515 RepID=UPI0004261BC5|nr:30S ribosomal protein S16 [Nakamurella lactea]
MAVKIKLARYGKIREPFYRVVVADARTRRSGRAIETIGRYNPKAEPSVIQIESERAQYWLGVGAQPTEAVVALFKVTGDWQKFKGLPGAEGTLKPQPERVDKKAVYEAAVAAAGGTVEDTSGATTARKKPAKKADDTKADDSKADDSKADDSKAEKPQALVDAPAAKADEADEAKADDAKSDEAPFGEGSHAPIADDAQPDGFPIKGNASSKLYHRPGTPFYDSTVAEVWFATEEAAEKAGFSLPKSQQGDE